MSKDARCGAPFLALLVALSLGSLANADGDGPFEKSLHALRGAPVQWVEGDLETTGIPDFPSRMEVRWIRLSEGGDVRSLVEVRDPGSRERSVQWILALEGRPIARIHFDPERRRWQRLTGLLPTDPFLDSGLLLEELAFAPSTARARGPAEPMDGGELRIALAPYHHYGEGVARIDTERGLPVAVDWLDLALQPFRSLRYEEPREFDGRPFPSRIRARDRLSGSESVLVVRRAGFSKTWQPGALEEERITRRIRAGLPAVPLPGDD